MNQTAQRALEFYVRRGLPRHVAAGIVGNLYVESAGFDPAVIRGDRRGDKGTAHGIAQWRGNRWTNLKNWASANGLDHTNLDTQLAFVLEEVRPGSRYRDRIAASRWDDILAAETADDATTLFKRHYERPNRDPKVNKAADRTAVARNLAGQQTSHAMLPQQMEAPQSRPEGFPVQQASAQRPGGGGPGMAALLPQVRHDLAGKGRSEVPSSGIDRKVAGAAQRVRPDLTTVLTSGQEPAGRAPVGTAFRHPRGYAGDFDFVDAQGNRVVDDLVLHDIAMQMAADHQANIGYSNRGYMGPGRMHIDTMPLDQYPGAAQWGDTARSWRGNLDFARETGIGPMPLEGPIPPERPDVASVLPFHGEPTPAGPNGPRRPVLPDPTPPGPNNPRRAPSPFAPDPDPEPLMMASATPFSSADRVYPQPQTVAPGAPAPALPDPQFVRSAPVAAPQVFSPQMAQTLPTPAPSMQSGIGAGGGGLGGILSGLANAIASSAAAGAGRQQQAEREWQEAHARTLGPGVAAIADQMPRDMPGAVPLSRSPEVAAFLPTGPQSVEEILAALFGRPNRRTA